VMTKLSDSNAASSRLYDVFDYYIQLQNWWLILLLPPADNVEYDNIVYKELRKEIENNNLMNLTHELNGTSYKDIYQEAHSLVDKMLGNSKDNELQYVSVLKITIL